MTDSAAWLSAVVFIAICIVGCIGINRDYELLPRWSIPFLFLTGYVSGCIGFQPLYASIFRSGFSADSYADAYLWSFLLLPNGFTAGIITVGLTAFSARYKKAWWALPVAMLVVSHLAFWMHRDQFLSAGGLAKMNRWEEVIAMAGQPGGQSKDAFDQLLNHGMASQIPETTDTREQMYALLRADNKEHREIAIDMIAHGNWKLSPEALFPPDEGADLLQEYWVAKDVVKALVKRSQRTSRQRESDLELKAVWQALYSNSRRYQMARSAEDLRKLRVENRSRANAVGQLWQDEISRAAKYEPVVDGWLNP